MYNNRALTQALLEKENLAGLRMQLKKVGEFVFYLLSLLLLLDV